MPNVIRDLSDTSSYWAAVWTVCTLQDVHVICDAPIGCFNLVATAVPDYTDAVPHIENITPSVITETEVSEDGTAKAVQRTYENLRDEGILDGKQLVLISTAESEMIGSDLSSLVNNLQPGTTFFNSDSLNDDEWKGRDRILQWLWENYGADNDTDIEPEPGLVNIIGPTYGCFNLPSDLTEVQRLVEGAGGRINMIFPYNPQAPLEARLADITKLRKASINILLYREYGQTMAESLGQPYLYAPMGIQQTTEFIRELGEKLGTQEQAAAFIQEEKRGTLQAVWDLWRGPQSDWFSTITVGIVAPQTYVDGLKAYLGDELGMQITMAEARPGADNSVIRQQIHSKAPSFFFGSINEKIYLSEAGARQTSFIPAAFPGPVVRRSVGTPFMGYRGTVYLIQEIVNRLYEALFNFLPVDTAYANQRAGGGQGAPNGGGATANPTDSPGKLPWSEEAKALLDAAVEREPFLARISVSRELQMKVEGQARQRGLTEVTEALAAEVLQSGPVTEN